MHQETQTIYVSFYFCLQPQIHTRGGGIFSKHFHFFSLIASLQQQCQILDNDVCIKFIPTLDLCFDQQLDF